MTRYAQQERQALCDTMLAVGPTAATMCSPWVVRDLAAHLVLRETRPDLALGIMLKPLASRLERAQDELATSDFDELVGRVRSGPPWWSAASIAAVDEAMNRMEFFVHHEDVLRAQPGWTARALEAGLEKAVWSGLTRAAGMFYKRSPVGVVLDADRVGRHVAKKTADGAADASVVVRGSVADVVLYSYGRKSVANVSLVGPAEAVAALEGTRLSI